MFTIEIKDEIYFECYELVENEWKFVEQIYRKPDSQDYPFSLALCENKIYILDDGKLRNFDFDSKNIENLSCTDMVSFLIFSSNNKLFAINSTIDDGFVATKIFDENFKKWHSLSNIKLIKIGPNL